jgi:hypothetical protein
MIIKDTNDDKLKLTKTTLTEVTGERVEGDKWGVKLRDLKKEFPHLERGVLYRTDAVYGEVTGHMTYDPENYRIGCRRFSAKVFATIQKAIKETK